MRVGIIGCGCMGDAIGHALAGKHQLWFSDIDPGKAQRLAQSVQGSASLPDATDYLILAIKPQQLKDFQVPVPPRLLVSILSGKTYKTLKNKFPQIPVLRLMPNLAIRYGKGITALAEDPSLEIWKEEIADTFSPFGFLIWIPESLFDAVTALTGSGPAFFYAALEAMIEAGVRMGFPKETACELAKRMIEGALQTMEASGGYPEDLIPLITSPQGTTLAGLNVFKERKVREGIIATFEAACERSRELGNATE